MTLAGARAAQPRLDAVERPLWEPDWSNPTTARRLTLLALTASAVIVIWRRRRTA